MRSKSIRALSVLTVSGLLLVSFQNCGKAGFDGGSDEGLDFSSSRSKTATDPFAFNAAFDQISYNSCFGPGSFGKDGFFSIKAGAYTSGGVTLKKEFEDFVRNGETLRPLYPAKEVSVEQIKAYASASTPSQGASAQMALRTRSNLQQVRSPGGTTTEYLDFIPLLGDLTDDRWLHPIVSSGAGNWSRFFNLAPETSRRFEGELSYNANEVMAENMRNDLMSTGLLALTFRERSDTGLPSAARAPAEADETTAYGRGYRLQFSRAQTRFTACASGNCNATAIGIYALSPTNVLTEVLEVDLEKPSQTLATWKCGANRRYTIVRYADRNLCPPDVIGNINTDAGRQEYEIVRRHFPASEWSVNLSLRCMVPLKSGCYDPTYSNLAIAYDQRQACFQNLDSYKSRYGATYPAKLCAQVASICIK